MKNLFARMRVQSLAVALCVFSATDVSAQTMTYGSKDGRTVTVTALSSQIVKISNLAPGEQPSVSRASVLDGTNFSAGKVTDQGTTRVMTLPGGMTVAINADGVLTVTGAEGRRILTDKGVRTLAGRNGVEIDIAGNGSLYGSGERGHKLNLRGDTLVMYNRQNYGYTGSDSRINQMNITMPLFLSNDGYAIVFDDYAAGEMILGDKVEYITEGKSPVSYYVVSSADGSLASLTESLSELTGRQELPPFWSLGYITSKYGYKTRAETEAVVDTLKSLGYPVDGIVLDLYWYGKEQDMGRLEWDPDQWPDARKMLSDLKKKGVSLVAISQPYVLRNGRAIANYEQMAPKGMFVADSTGTAPQEVKIWVGEGGMFDVSNPETRAWLTNRYRELTEMGVTGWWGDLGEPEVHPETAIHANGLNARLYHNQYGNDWSEIVYDMFKENYPDTRIMTMMRGGTTGLQRYDVFPWSTDVSRSWGGLEPQITIMTQSGLSGLGYMGHDVGGFAVDPDNAYLPELYVRWLQLGTFSPILRTHAQEYAEPYLYPQYQDIILPLIKERYRWLPYNYTLAYENASKGYPLVRPLEFHSTSPTGAYDNLRDEYMWGSEVLVAPVLKEGAREREVVFPATSPVWYDMNNPVLTYKGGTTATVQAPLGVLPMFARAGAFIPTADYEMTNTGDYRNDDYTISYYPAPEGVRSSYTMFEDDRTTPSAISSNAGLMFSFSALNNGNETTITVESEGDNYDPAKTSRNMILSLRAQAKAPKSITCNGKKIKFSYDSSKQTVSVPFVYTVDKRSSFVIKY